MTAADSRPWLGAAVLVGIVTVLALVVRTIGIDFLMPQQSEPDAVVFEKQVQVMREGVRAQERHPLYAFYPHLVARIVTMLPEEAADEGAVRTLAGHLERARARRVDIRVVVAWLSVIAVPLTWWLARRFLPPPWALAAAVLMGASVLDLWFAQQARPHAAEASFSFLAVIAAMEARRRGRWRDWVGAQRNQTA